jgi:PASTA domain-containing protein
MSLQSDPVVRECPNCGHPDHQQRDFCASCGEYLRWDLTEEQPVRPATAPTPTSERSQAPDPAPRRPEPPTAVMQPIAEKPAPVALILHATQATAPAGGLATFAGTLRNQSGVVDNYDFRVSGLPAEWVDLPPTAYLLPYGSAEGHEQTFQLAVMPPRAPEAEARAWPFTLEVVSRDSGQVAARADATLVIEPFHQVEVHAKPQRRRGRTRGTYALEIVNAGNADASVALTAADTDDACEIRVDPPAVRVAPGRRGTARLRVRPRRAIWWGRADEHRFDLRAALREDPAHVPAPPQLVFRQLPWIPWWVPAVILVLIALAIALLALRGEQIVVPEVRGQSVQQAQQTLVEAGLESTPRVQEQVVQDGGQVGRVIAQNPAAGEQIDSGDALILQAGVANQAASVPEVRGATRDQAQQLLGAAGLTLGAIEPGDASAEAVVDFQNPAAGESARLGSPVSLILVEPEEPADEEDVGDEPEQPQQPEPTATPELNNPPS